MQLLKTIEREKMPSTMFDSVKDRIRTKLATDRPGADVRVYVDRTPYGVWVWDEKGMSHVQMKNQEILKALGPSADLTAYLEGLEEYRVGWKDVLVEEAGR
jgi:hypothetical protein